MKILQKAEQMISDMFRKDVETSVLSDQDEVVKVLKWMMTPEAKQRAKEQLEADARASEKQS